MYQLRREILLKEITDIDLKGHFVSLLSWFSPQNGVSNVVCITRCGACEGPPNCIQDYQDSYGKRPWSTLSGEERSLHSALMVNTIWNEAPKVPHLGGIHEFSAAAYVKDLKARTLDVCDTQLLVMTRSPMAIVFIGHQNGQYLLMECCSIMAM